MTKKLALLAVLTLALLGAGCEDPCEQGLALRNDATTYSATVSTLISQTGDITQACATVAPWQPKLTSYSNFARHVAYDYFYAEESRCASWGYERRCYVERHHGRRYTRCYDQSVCRFYERTPYRRDGFDQANELSDLMRNLKSDFTGVCVAFQNGQNDQVRDYLGHAKIKLDASIQNADYVLTRAGCYDRRGH